MTERDDISLVQRAKRGLTWGPAGLDEETSAAPHACRGSASGILLAVRGFFVNHPRININNKQEGFDGGIGEEEEEVEL